MQKVQTHIIISMFATARRLVKFITDKPKIINITDRCMLANNLSMIPVEYGSVTFTGSFNRPICQGELPDHLTDIVFTGRFDQPLDEKSLPDNLETLHFRDRYSRHIKQNVLPNSLKLLSLECEFNNLIDPHILPEGLESLWLCGSYNRPILPNVLPSNLKNLTLTGNFNQEISPGTLPDNLQVITFGENYDRKISNIPESTEIRSVGKYIPDINYTHICERSQVGKLMRELPSNVEIGKSRTYGTHAFINVIISDDDSTDDEGSDWD